MSAMNAEERARLEHILMDNLPGVRPKEIRLTPKRWIGAMEAFIRECPGVSVVSGDLPHYRLIGLHAVRGDEAFSVYIPVSQSLARQINEAAMTSKPFVCMKTAAGRVRIADKLTAWSRRLATAGPGDFVGTWVDDPIPVQDSTKNDEPTRSLTFAVLTNSITQSVLGLFR